MLVTKKVKVSQSCPTFCKPMDCSPWNSPVQNTGVGSRSLLQGIFPIQGLNPGLPHCRWILYQLKHKGSPWIKWLQWEVLTITYLFYFICTLFKRKVTRAPKKCIQCPDMLVFIPQWKSNNSRKMSESGLRGQKSGLWWYTHPNPWNLWIGEFTCKRGILDCRQIKFTNQPILK